MSRIIQNTQKNTKTWNITIRVTKDEEKTIKKKILDLEMKIGEYAKKKLLES
ncbi:MAG: hypothetical protein QNJ54_35740 [Prochloraceae cyanobacterium]|nr:hypothetical protein [Prochloraceae cyanobacterium]